MTPALRVDSRRNFAAYTFDILFFMVGTFFVPTATVLVGFANRLTDDAVLIGVVGMVWAVSWYLPQIVAARIVHGKPRQKPYLFWSSLIGRQAFLVIAAWIALTSAEQPVLTIWIMVGGIAFFNICDALAGVAWFDMLSRALSPRKRSRSLVLGQIGGAILGVGAGVLITRVLAPDGLPFPQNYAFIFFCAWACFNVSIIAVIALQELPIRESERHTANESNFSTQLRASFKSDKLFKRVLVVRGLTSIEAMSAAFYLVYITNLLGLPDQSVGTFTLASVFGGIIGLIVFGAIAERKGTRRVGQTAAVLQFVAPLMACLTALSPTLATNTLFIALNAAYFVFIIIIGVNGAINHSLMLGILGYLMDASPESRRAMYVGVMNTLGGVIALAPIVGGLIIEIVSRFAPTNVAYACVFGLTAICTGAGMLLSFRLPAVAPHTEHETATMLELAQQG